MSSVDNIPRVLARNNACHQCRRRKLKCDAVRPSCCHCSKPRVRGQAAHQPPEPCTWDALRPDPSPSSSTTGTPLRRHRSPSNEAEAPSRGSGKAKKPKIAVPQPRSSTFDALIPPTPNGTYPTPRPYYHENTLAPIRQHVNYTVADPERWNTITQRPYSEHPASLPRSTSYIPSRVPPPLPSHPGPFWASRETPRTEEYPTLSGPSEVFWPDWPRDLPSLQVVQHAVGLFFEKIPTLPKMLHRPSFMSQLQLPPSHYAFPGPALLHAILAITANHMPEAALATRAYFPIGTPNDVYDHPVRDLDPDQEQARILGFGAGWRYYASESPVAKFQLWHRRKAYESCPVYFDKGEKLLQCVQAHVIATSVDQYNAWWVDLWMEAGACLRMAVPLGLHESKDVHPLALAVTMSKDLMRPAMTPQEHDERVRTFWMAYMLERSVSFATIWPASLDDDDISIELPIIQAAFDAGRSDCRGTQSLRSHDVLTTHPPEHSDSLNLLIKAHTLQGEINRFFRKYSKRPHHTHTYAGDPALRALLSKVSALRLACPAHLRRPGQLLNGALDIDLLAATIITYAGSVTLAEPLITVDSWTHDISRMCLTAIRSVLSILYDITATSFDLTLLPPSCPWAWTMAARCLLRFIAAAGEAGDLVSVQVFSSEVEVFRLAMKRYGERYPLGKKHLQLIDGLIERNAPIKSMHYSTGEIFKAVSLSTIGESSSRTTPTFTSLHTPPALSTLGATHNAGPGNHFAPASLVSLDNPPVTYPHDTAGFDISSFSFDYDAMAGMTDIFAGAETVFNGPDFLLK